VATRRSLIAAIVSRSPATGADGIPETTDQPRFLLQFESMLDLEGGGADLLIGCTDNERNSSRQALTEIRME
jgi:hypothetical protein